MVFSSFLCAAPFALIDTPQPGALVRGKLTQPATLYFDDKVLKTSANGWFVFGVSRDATGEVMLRWENHEGSGEERYALPAREYDIQRIDGLPQKMVTPPESVLERIRKDNQQVAKGRSINTDFEYFAQSFIWPAEGRISGVYGSQRVLNGEPKRPHYGVDVAGPVGTPVIAPADGVVTLFVPDMYYSGGTLIIDHGHQVTSTFIHLHKAHVKAGDKVKQGQLIAEIGETGRVTGAHLDWRINWGSVRVDPQLLVPARD
ncbi:M23 family metallopeptidase [Alteromonas facilis]|uniref:M23 family metallopeptidase n=1 Tax=Alteromonas facilis TaxID=2048004 RepID=UPI003B82E709